MSIRQPSCPLVSARIRGICLFTATCLAVFLIGCGSESPAPTAPAASVSQSPPPVDQDQSGPAAEKLTKDEADEFAKAWVVAAETGDANAAKQLVWWSRIVDNMLEPLDPPEAFKQQFSKGFLSTIHTGIIQQLKTVVESGGSYRLVSVVKRDNHFHVICRLIDPNSGMNYHDLRLVRDKDKVRADRFFVAATGESLADTLRPLALQALKAEPSFLERLSGAAATKMDGLERQFEMLKAARAGEKAQAMSLYGQLTEEQKKLKLVQLAKILAIGTDDEAAYLQAINEYEQSFPNDPSLGLMTLDAGVLKKDPDLLESAANRLVAWVGSDPYISLMMAGTLTTMGENERATRWSKGANPEDVDLALAFDFDLNYSLSMKDHDRSLKDLEILRDRFGYQFSDLRTADGFEDFVKSDQFRKWKP